jgi:signal transduction histidine kinase
MNLLQHTFRRLLLPLLAVVIGWSAVMYLSLRRTVYEDVDEALHSRMVDLLDDELLPAVDHSRDSLRSATDLYLQAILQDDARTFRARYPEGRYSDTLLFDRVEQEEEPFRTLSFVMDAENGPYRITLLASLLNAEELLSSILLNVALLIGAVILVVLVVERALLRKLWAPFHEALDRMRGYRADRGEVPRFSPTPVREFQELQRSLQELMRVNTEQYAVQKEFTDHAAHELHTPIAVAQAKLEELLMLPGLTEEQAALLAPAVDSLKRLSAVNKGLLQLARIGNPAQVAAEPVDIGSVTRRVLQEQSPLAEFKGLKLEVYGDASPQWRMAPELAEVLVGNLLRNAIGHNVPDGWVRVSLTKHALVVENSGARLERPAQELMARFVRGGGAGTGLGLAIVQRIAERYGLRVDYQEREGVHRVAVSAA